MKLDLKINANPEAIDSCLINIETKAVANYTHSSD